MSQFNDALRGIGSFFTRMQLGLKAVTVQPYTEVNSKFGVQYEMSIFNASVAGGATYDVIVTTGDVPLSLKGVSLSFDVELLSGQWFKTPSYSGGSAVTVYNLREAIATAPEVTITEGVTVTATGSPVSSKAYSIGSAGVGNRHIASVSLDVGAERILDANTTYLYRITNEDNVPAIIAASATWYEGELDYP